MGKLKLQIQTSIDGFISGPNGEMNWMIWDWDDKLKDFVTEITKSTDTIVLGRRLAEGFISHWQANPTMDGAEKINSSKKVVFTKTINDSKWENTVLAKGDIVEEINDLKNKAEQDIISYGGGDFVSSLIKNNLVDEFYIFINPSILGEGMSIFKNVEYKKDLKLEFSQSFDCGITVIKYTRK